MHTPHVPTRPKVARHYIQDPITRLYARLERPPPSRPEPAEDTAGAVYWRDSHIKFRERPLATSFDSHEEALAAFGTHIGVAALEIVRCDV